MHGAKMLFKIKNTYLKIEKLLSNMKFAVVIIFFFSIALIFGTFMESYHGREFANRLVYKSYWFMGIQLLMFLSILTATLVRLPAKKRLYGFYTIHAGLILLFIGSFITYMNGIDGIVELRPNEPTNKIQLDEDILAIRTTSGKVIRKPLPQSAFSTHLNENIEGFVLKEYLPSSDLKTKWIKLPEASTYEHSSKYFLYNENVSQDFILSLASLSDFKSQTKLGPLSVSYMPKELYKCFKNNTDTPFILWNVMKNTCTNVNSKDFIVGETKNNKKFMVHPWNGEKLKFFPNISPLPLNDDLSKKTDTPFRVFSKEIFEKSPNLFLFGESLAYYKKRKKAWVGKEFQSLNDEIKLPWMNFKIKLMEHREDAYPSEVPEYTRPIQDNGEIVQGALKAIKINVFGIDHWVRNDKPLTLSDGQRNMQFMIIKSEKRLPYQFTLEKFKMDKNPGTNDPASYESFVSLLDGRQNIASNTHHIYMNNPLKYDEFTFYQSSYFQLGPDLYGSALSVNYDPGRALKYFGSFLIVFGSIWHFYIRRKKIKIPKSIQEQALIGDLNV
jgi:hypothetical protein